MSRPLPQVRSRRQQRDNSERRQRRRKEAADALCAGGIARRRHYDVTLEDRNLPIRRRKRRARFVWCGSPQLERRPLDRFPAEPPLRKAASPPAGVLTTRRRRPAPAAEPGLPAAANSGRAVYRLVSGASPDGPLTATAATDPALQNREAPTLLASRPRLSKQSRPRSLRAQTMSQVAAVLQLRAEMKRAHSRGQERRKPKEKFLFSRRLRSPSCLRRAGPLAALTVHGRQNTHAPT